MRLILSSLLKFNNRIVLINKMPQRSISSFFKKTSSTNDESDQKEEEGKGKTSPEVKKLKNGTSSSPIKKKSDEAIKSPDVKKLKLSESPKASTSSPSKDKSNGASSNSVSSKPASTPAKKLTTWNNDFNPAKSKYHPIDDASWEKEQSTPYLALARTFDLIEATSKRLEITEILANYFRSVILLTPDDLLPSVNLCLNRLAPAYEGLELGIASTNIMKAISQATGRDMNKIRKDEITEGDLGRVAEKSRSTQKTLFQPLPLTLLHVFNKLKEIASITGGSSHSKKIDLISSLIVACKHSEARFLVRTLEGKLRIGLAEQTVLQSLAQACYLTPPNQDREKWPPKIINAGKKTDSKSLKILVEEYALKLKSAYCECPNYDLVIKAILEDGIADLGDKIKLTPGIPPRPMLAQPTKGVADVLKRFDNIKFTCEYKYDGERAQIHLLENGSIEIYSRNQERNTTKYPDIISRFQSCLKEEVKSCIIDSEAVAWDLEKKSILPFQVLTTRKRKDAKEDEIKVQVMIFAFDLLYLNGENLIKKPLVERRELLRKHFEIVEGQFDFATSLDSDNVEEIQEFLEKSIEGNCEGLMVKTLENNASYELNKRSNKWLKLKKDYLEAGGDSLDLVVIGGYHGKGKRKGNYGGFLLACYDPDNEEYQSICKLGTGFKDEELLSHTENLKAHKIPNAKSYYRYATNECPDDWFDAVQVWEIKCADLSLSPIYKAAAGIVDPERGISLRFPRFLRIREDKTTEEATTPQQVAKMYNSQVQVQNSKGDNTLDDDEFY